MRHTIRIVLATGVTVVALASCSNQNPGSPTTGDTSTSNTSSNRSTDSPSSEKPNSNGAAPAISGPELSVANFSSNACQAFTSEQLTTLGLQPDGTPRNNGASCTWRPEDLVAASTYMVTFPPAGTTLDRYYKNKAQYPAFEESEVANYPAANFDITDAKHGQCSTIVGVAKDAVFIVQASAGSDDPQYSTPCTLSAKAAEIVVNNLKGDR